MMCHTPKRTPTQRQLVGRYEEEKMGMTRPYQKPPEAQGDRGRFYDSNRLCLFTKK